MIREIVVVEGREDTRAIQEAVQADTIETGGSALNEMIIDRIRLAHEKRGVIIFTDPDHAGERIRKIISQTIPGCKHAFLPAEEATKKGDVGIENASPKAIQRALALVRTPASAQTALFAHHITWPELVDIGLVGTSDASERRLALGKKLRIGYANAKQFYKRCVMFGITKSDVENAMKQLGLNEKGMDAK